MKKRLQRILAILCTLALAAGCWAVSLSEGEEEKQPNRVITVEWNDEGNYDGIRPASVEMSIGDTTVTLSESNGWTASAYAEEGAEWTLAAVSGYTSTSGGTEVTSVTYRHPVPRTQLSASVAWEDNGNASGTRPASVHLRLLADGQPFGTPLTANSANGWTVSWEDLHVTRKGSSTPISYSLEQVEKLNAYTTGVSGAVVTNTLKTGTLSLNASLGNVPEGADTGSIFVTVSGPDPSMPVTLSYAEAAGYNFGTVVAGSYLVRVNNADTVVEGYVMDAASRVADAVMVNGGGSAALSVSLSWNAPAEEEEEVDPWAYVGGLIFEIVGPDPRMPMVVTYDQFSGGRFEIDDLLPGEYAVVERNAEGLIRTYVLTSDSVTGMTVTVAADGTATASLYNRYEPGPTPEPDEELIDIPVTKVWDDNNDSDGIRPASITVYLYGDGVIKESASLSAGTGWTHTFTGLPRYKEDGTEIVYSVNEDAVPGYSSRIEGTTLINTHTSETTSASVVKVWEDNGPGDARRPASISVILMPTGMGYTLTADGGWSLTVSDLPAMSGGVPISYSWTEATVLGYTLVSATTSGGVTTLTNRVQETPKVQEGQAQPKVPRDVTVSIDDYDTALGLNVLINHVGDCFD